MMAIDGTVVAAALTERLGLGLVGEYSRTAGGPSVRLRPVDLPEARSFALECLIGWRTVSVAFRLGPFAAALLSRMQEADEEQRTLLRAFAKTAVDGGADVRLVLNGSAVSLESSGDWPAEWTSIEIQLTRTPIAIDTYSHGDIERYLLEFLEPVLGMALALMPVEASSLSGEVEGGVSRVPLDRYERSRLNRAACIAHYGAGCQVCGIALGTLYGDLGDGFIEVHHIEPLAALEKPRPIDPIRDLVPICPNCHAIIHRRSPPIPIQELQVIVRDARS